MAVILKQKNLAGTDLRDVLGRLWEHAGTIAWNREFLQLEKLITVLAYGTRGVGGRAAKPPAPGSAAVPVAGFGVPPKRTSSPVADSSLLWKPRRKCAEAGRLSQHAGRVRYPEEGASGARSLAFFAKDWGVWLNAFIAIDQGACET